MNFRLTFLGALPLLLAGCPAPAPTADANLPDAPMGVDAGSLTIEQLLTRTAELTCDQVYRCCDDTELGNLATVGITDPTSCRSYYRNALRNLEDSVNAGRLRYNPASASACLDQLSSAACGAAMSEPSPECASVLAGAVANGAACTSTQECMAGSYCGNSTCQLRIAVGESCEERPSACVSGAVCTSTGCRIPLENGATCTEPSQCRSGSCERSMCTPPRVTCDGR